MPYDVEFSSTLFKYPGNSGWTFVTVPEQHAPSSTYAWGRTPVVANVDGYEWKTSVWREKTEVNLSAKEFQLLETFMRHPGEVLSRYQLLEHAWDYDYENRSNIVDVYVRYLRDKIDRPFGVTQLETVRGAGYRLKD